MADMIGTEQPESANAGCVQRVVSLLDEIAKQDSEMFEDGLSCDLHDSGIHTITDAYRQGRDDLREEILERMKQANAPDQR